MDQEKFQQLIELDLDYYRSAQYFANPATPIHGWFLINESSSLEQVVSLLEELECQDYGIIIDPFCGSGTVGLGCVLACINFLGFERLSNCVIGTRAKLTATKTEFQQFQTSKERILNLLEDIADNSPDLELDPKTLGTLIFSLQKELIESISPSTIYLYLSCVFSAAFAVSRLQMKTILDYIREVKSNIEKVSSELSEIKYRAGRAHQSVYWCDSSRVSWSDIFVRENFSYPVKALLLTSPTHISSFRDTSDYSAASNKAADYALTLLGDKNIPPEFERDLPEIEDVVRAAPQASLPYLNQIANVLRRFSEVASPGSRAVIECENAMDEDTVIEADRLICTIAAKLNYTPERVRVTHYVVKPGVITCTPGLLRGSLIYLAL